MEEAYEWKRSKYQELVEQCQRSGWRACCEPIEVGCRGFMGHSLCRVYTLVGIVGAAKRKAIKSTMEAAEQASRWLWIRMNDQWTNAAGTQARVLSTLAASPEGGCMMLKDPKHLRISETSLMMCPSASKDVSFTDAFCPQYDIKLKSVK